MTFNHNDHYHGLLMRQIPPGCRRALDVGCGTGRFARRLTAAGIPTDAVDASAEVISAARQLSRNDPPRARPSFQEGDITRLNLLPGHYDYIACLASIHHVPFSVAENLRAALAPGGVLVILGCYRAAKVSDRILGAAAVPVNLAVRAALAAWTRMPAPGRDRRQSVQVPPMRAPSAPTQVARMSLAEIRAEAANALPGYRLRRLFFWRYLLVYRAPEGPAGTAP